MSLNPHQNSMKLQFILVLSWGNCGSRKLWSELTSIRLKTQCSAEYWFFLSCLLVGLLLLATLWLSVSWLRHLKIFTQVPYFTGFVEPKWQLSTQNETDSCRLASHIEKELKHHCMKRDGSESDVRSKQDSGLHLNTDSSAITSTNADPRHTPRGVKSSYLEPPRPRCVHVHVTSWQGWAASHVSGLSPQVYKYQESLDFS